jgi:methylglyoxal reductase
MNTWNAAGLSPVGFGAWEAGGGRTWGAKPSVAGVLAAMHTAFDFGVNWVDTAEVYGGGGGSERLVGAAIKDRPEVKVCSKVAPQDETHFTEPGMRAALESSLDRLGRSRLDVYLLHWPASTVAVRRAWNALIALKSEGLIDSIGVSNFSQSDVLYFAGTGELDYVQGQASLLYLRELDELGTICHDLGIGFMAYGALGYGLLSGMIDTSMTFEDWRGGEVSSGDFFCAENYQRYFSCEARSDHLSMINDLREIVAEIPGVSLPQLAIGWLLAQPCVTTVLAGTRNARHAVENAAAADLCLTAEQLHAVDSVVRRHTSSGR